MRLALASDVVNDASGEQQGHTFSLYLERVRVSIAAWSAEKQVDSYHVLLQQHVKLANVRVSGVFYLFVAEILLVVVDGVLDLDPECLVVFDRQAIVQFE